MTRKDAIFIVFLIIFSIIASATLFNPGFYYSHDGVLHTVRLAKFYQALSEGQIIPRWVQSLDFGLGTPVLMFYGVLPNYLGSLFHFLGFNFQNSIKMVLGFSFVLSAVAFYFFAREKFGKLAGFLGTLLYLWAPYRFLDVYVRGAVPESFAFIFPPLIFLSGEKLISKKWFVMNVLAICALILSHNILALLFVGVYLLYLGPKKIVLLGLAFGIILSSFFLWPAFFLQSAINLDSLKVGDYYQSNFASLLQIVYSPWGFGTLNSNLSISVQLGLAQWLAVLLGITLVIRAKKKRELVFFLVVLAGCILLMTNYSAFLWDMFTPLQIVLYPWRFLAVAIFSAAVVASAVISLVPKKLLVFGFLVVLFYANRNYLQVAEPFDKPDSYYLNYRGTADVQGEFLAKGNNKEIFTNSPLVKVSDLLSVGALALLVLVYIGWPGSRNRSS